MNMNYYDRRNIAADQYNRQTFNERAMTLAFMYEDEEGEEISIALPAKFETCSLCGGTAKHVNPAIDEHGISASEFAEDPEFAESYFDGTYDVTCYGCSGKRVVPIINFENLNETQKKAYEIHLDDLRDDAEFESISRAERAMGA